MPTPTQNTPPPSPLLRFARRALAPIERFMRVEASSGILLLVITALALAWANSPLADSYTRLWQIPLGITIGSFSFERSLAWFVNDGLMVIFFFVVGMEIRREIHQGELSDLRRATLPAAAALGGILAPATLYLAFAGGAATRPGWGVPMATDIAFAVGILSLLGNRVPATLRVLLLALAIIDDLGAILVIALFYSSGLAFSGLLVAGLGIGGLLAMKRLGVRAKLAYVAPALVLWAGIYAMGIHPTIAGVIVGLMTPVRAAPDGPSPAESLIEKLHPWVAFAIMPIFALANAGVALGGGTLDASSWQVVTGVTVGLVVGKPLGVLLLSWLALRLRLASLPVGLGPRHLVVLGVVAGVGFTMSLFIAQLAFTDGQLLLAAKIGVLVASGGAAIGALILGRILLKPLAPAPEPAPTD
jgi:NhaA family Na+:H+ antiporter